MTLLHDHIFLRACRRENTERAPVWFMRQAGRYLPQYREIRKKYDFLTMVKTPELAAEVTIQPVDIIGVDAAIIFSDILVIPEAMGMKLVIEEGKGGPRLPDPIRSYSQLKQLRTITAEKDLKYVMDAIALTKERLEGRVPLIGFSGAPWTLFCYMVEGSGSKDFRYAKEMIFTQPEESHKLLGMIRDAVSSYLIAQIHAGADCIQIFDTWAGLLTPDDFQTFALEYISEIIRDVRAATSTKTPIIIFCKGANHSLAEIASTGCDVIGLDWTIDISEAKGLVGNSVALQGNLDPMLLYAPEYVIRSRVEEIAERMGSPVGHIFNLGHGITPDVDPERAKCFVDSAKAAYQKLTQ